MFVIRPVHQEMCTLLNHTYSFEILCEVEYTASLRLRELRQEAIKSTNAETSERIQRVVK